MAIKELRVDAILHKSASSSEWTTKNPILGQGEVGYDTDIKDIKIGNGATVWNSLPFYNSKNVTKRTIVDDTVLGKVKCLSFGDNDLDRVKCTIIDENTEYQQMELLEVLMLNVVALFYEDDTYAMPFGYEGNFDGVHLLIEGLSNTSKVELVGNGKQLLIKAVGYMCNPNFDPTADIEDAEDFKGKAFIDFEDYKSIIAYIIPEHDVPIPDYGYSFSILNDLVFKLPLAGGGGGGGYGNTGLGTPIKKEDVTFFEDEGNKLKADYVYTGTVDPIEIEVNGMSLFAYILFNAVGGEGFQDAVSVEPVSFDFSTIDCAVTRLYAEIDGVEYSLPELMGVDSKFSFRPFFNSGTRAVVAMVADSDLYQVEIIIKNDGNAEGRRILEYEPVSSGGGGGVSISEEQVYIDSSEWYEIEGRYEVIKYINDVDYDSMIWYSAETNSLEDFADAGVVMTEQGYGQVTFSCKEVPQNQISVIVRWQ